MSGQQIGSVVGGVIGAYFGGQFGYAIGSAIGGAIGGYVDPTIIKGPKLTDATQQTASDGIPIPWGHGTFPTAGNIIWTSDLFERKKEDDGKGTGIVNVTYHYYRSYAIGICQGVRQEDGTYLPIEGILVVKQNGKIVYDVRPGVSQETQAQNAKFMRQTRFYLGSETQDPDSVIESHEGVGNSPAYPGTVYMVRENIELTESGGAIEQFEFVVSICGDIITIPGEEPPFKWMIQSEESGRLYVATDPSVWSESFVSFPGNYVSTIGNRIIVYDPPASSGAEQSTDYGQTFTAVSGWPASAVAPMLVLSSGRWVLLGTSGSNANVFYSDDDGGSWTTVNIGGQAFFIAGNDDCIIVSGFSNRWISTDAGQTFSGPTANGFTVTAVGYLDGHFVFGVNGAAMRWSDDNGSTINVGTGDDPASQVVSILPMANNTWLAAVRTGSVNTTDNFIRSTDGKNWQSVTTPSMFFGIGSEAQRFAADDAGDVVAVGSNSSGFLQIIKSEDFGQTWSLVTHSLTGFTVYSGVGIAVFKEEQGIPIPDAPGYFILDGQIIGPDATELERCKPTLAEIVADACLRSGLTLDDIDVSELTDLVDGFKVATETTAEAIISPLMSGFFFDAGEWDDKIRFIKRGGNVVGEISYESLCETDGDVIEETELQEVELLQKVNVRTIDPEAGFTVTTQTAERRTSTVRAKGEQTTEIPVVTDKDTQAKIADKKLKVGWSETRRLKTFIPYTLPQYTPTDVIGLTDGKGKRQRVRLMEMAEDSGRIEIREAMLDRQSSYTSNVQGVTHGAPTDTSPGLAGPTFGWAGNLPSLRTSDNVPGAYLAACGYLRGWGGCAVMLSVDGGVSYQEVTRFLEPSSMGTLAEACTASSEPIRVFMNSGVLSSITDAQLALRMNAFAITTGVESELGQFRDAVIDSSQIYELTNTIRGGLGTTAASHLYGDPFVMVASAQFVPLDIGLAGRTLYFKFVSFGTSADDTEPYPFMFSPIFTSVVVDAYADENGEHYADEDGNTYYSETST